jgi:hypothetical protein
VAVLSPVLLNLYTGPTQLTPAPLEITQALEGVQVTRSDSAPCGFQLTFHIERTGAAQDYALLTSPLLKPFSRIAVTVSLSGMPSILIDGYITHQELAPTAAPGGSTLTVTGEDVSVKMDMMEISIEWPAMGDFLIAEAVLAKYWLIGIVPDVQPTLSDLIPFGYVAQQNSTDRCYAQQLANKNGYLFYVEPGPTLGSSRAYWGPPVLTGTPQLALNVDMGPFTNIETITFGYNALAPTINYGLVQVGIVPVPVLIGASTRTPLLSTDPAMQDYSGLASNPLSFLDDLASLQVRGTLFQHQGLNIVDAYTMAQSITNLSTDEVVTVEGTLDAVRYGAVLNAPGLVVVRGAGTSYDGIYYVKQVTHAISTRLGEWNYKQNFKLTREGVGTTIQEVPPS